MICKFACRTCLVAMVSGAALFVGCDSSSPPQVSDDVGSARIEHQVNPAFSVDLSQTHNLAMSKQGDTSASGYRVRPLKLPGGEVANLDDDFQNIVTSISAYATDLKTQAKPVDSPDDSFASISNLTSNGYVVERDHAEWTMLRRDKGNRSIEVQVSKGEERVNHIRLIEKGVIVSELEPTLTSDGSLQLVVRRLIDSKSGYAEIAVPYDLSIPIPEPGPELLQEEPPCEDPDPLMCDDGSGSGGGGGGGGPSGDGSGSKVAFIHGLNGGTASWSFGMGWLEHNTNIDGSIVSYASSGSISGIATGVASSVANSDVVVAHSMGGLVSREIIRQNLDGDLGALITVGTPHLGAPAADNAHLIPGLVVDFAGQIITPLAAIIFYLSGIDQTEIANIGFTVDLITSRLGIGVGLAISGDPPANDMVTSSPFLSTLNADVSLTIPDDPSKTFFVYGDEDHNTHWRIAQSAAFPGQVENGNWAGYMNDVADIYELAFIAGVVGFLDLAIGCMEGEYGMAVCENAIEFFSVVASFYIAEQQIRTGQQQVFSQLLHDAAPGEEDGVVPIWSQAPQSFSMVVPIQNYIKALGANHLEQRVHPEVLGRIAIILRNHDPANVVL